MEGDEAVLVTGRAEWGKEALVSWEHMQCECCPNSVHARSLAAARPVSSKREQFDRVIGSTPLTRTNHRF
jgi:hypothetical protein